MIICHTHMRRQAPERKLRKTYTLSAKAVAVIEQEKKARRTQSASSALEALLRDRSCQQQMARVAASISDYYDSLSEEQMKEDQRWGAFAETQFPLE
jgi:S-methylmethionine-dependent homocysteine/selenocysteine methylase